MISRLHNTQPNIKISAKKQQNDNKGNANPGFKGAFEVGTQVLNFLNTSPAIGACFIDFSSMVLPRTIVDFSRSPDAGMETGFRESSGTINHAMAGVVGLGAGYAVSHAFNKQNGVKTHLVFANGETIETLAGLMDKSKLPNDAGYDTRKYWESFFDNLKGLNTTTPAADGNIWRDFNVQTKEGKNLRDAVVDMLSNSNDKNYKTPKALMAKLKEEITGTLGAGSTYKLEISGRKAVEGDLEGIINKAYAMRRAVLDKAAHDKTAVVKDLEKFVKGIQNKKVATVAAGLAVPVAIGVSAQPLNRYLTKKRTGSDGFVGVEGREPDHSAKFKIGKTLLGVLMGSAMISTILKHPMDLYTHIGKASKELLANLQYRSMVPTLDQFKFIYGMTIMSRIFAARDKNEVRESAIKDSLGFANWLILGGIVSKLSAKAFNKGIINYDEKNGKGIFKFIQHAVEKTHEEILYPALKEMGIDVLDGSGKAIPFRKLVSMMKNKAAQSKNFENLAKETLSKLKYKNYSQLLGYLYSAVILGVGIPKLNIAITKHCEKKAAQKKALNTPNDKMKVDNDFMKLSAQDSKTFGAFLSQM